MGTRVGRGGCVRACLFGVAALALLAPCVSSAGAQATGVPATPPHVGTLAPDEVESGCGCVFRAVPTPDDAGRVVVYWLRGRSAKMRIDGRLEVLDVREESPRGEAARPLAPGEHLRFALANERARVSIACTVTDACPEDALECEATGLAARIVVQSASRTTESSAVGECGC